MADPGVDRASRRQRRSPPRRRLAAGGRVRGHPLRDRGRDRQDHHRPARGAQRLPAPRRWSSSPTRSSAPARTPTSGVIVLTGEGPLAFCSGGDQRVRGDSGYLAARAAAGRPLPRDRPARADAPPAQAGRGDGGRLRDRRRPRAARGLRPHDRRRQRPLRPDRAAGWAASTAASAPACSPSRSGQKKAKEIWFLCRQYDARRGARHGAREHRRAARGARGGDGALVPRDARALAVRAAAAEGELQRRRGRAGRHPAARPRRQPPLLHERGGAGGPRRLPRAARGRTSRSSPSGREPLPACGCVGRPAAHAAGGGRPGARGHRAGGLRGRLPAAAPSSPRWSAACSSRSGRTSPTTTPTRAAAPTPRTGSARCA